MDSSVSLRHRPVSRLGPVLWALLFASLVCSGMLGARMVVARTTQFAGLFFNLMLAWIPLGLALGLRGLGTEAGWRRFLFWGIGLLWFLFYPNCFYIVTDFIHMKKFGSSSIPKWYDMMTTSGFAFAGVFLGILSLYLAHLAVRERFGYRTGWVFAVVMLGLGSIGIYVGRFLRWNSWEVFTRPAKLVGQVGELAHNSHSVLAFTVTFFFFSLMVYYFVVTMARLHEGEM